MIKFSVGDLLVVGSFGCFKYNNFSSGIVAAVRGREFSTIYKIRILWSRVDGSTYSEIMPARRIGAAIEAKQLFWYRA